MYHEVVGWCVESDSHHYSTQDRLECITRCRDTEDCDGMTFDPNTTTNNCQLLVSDSRMVPCELKSATYGKYYVYNLQ